MASIFETGDNFDQIINTVTEGLGSNKVRGKFTKIALDDYFFAAKQEIWYH
jgi:hypothetical protein